MQGALPFDIVLQNVRATPEEIDAIREKHPNVTIVVQPDWRLFMSG